VTAGVAAASASEDKSSPPLAKSTPPPLPKSAPPAKPSQRALHEPVEPRKLDLKGEAYLNAHRQIVLLLERRFRSHKLLSIVQKASTLGKRRRLAVAELVSSEATFVAGLKEVIEAFLKPSRKLDSSVLRWVLALGVRECMTTSCSESERKQIFLDVEELHEFHANQLLVLFRDAESAKSWTMLKKAFERVGEVSNLYTSYVNNYDAAAKALHTLAAGVAHVLRRDLTSRRRVRNAERASFGTFVDSVAGGRARLASLLVTPVQACDTCCRLSVINVDAETAAVLSVVARFDWVCQGNW
jgi:hypothetical protein